MFSFDQQPWGFSEVAHCEDSNSGLLDPSLTLTDDADILQSPTKLGMGLSGYYYCFKSINRLRLYSIICLTTSGVLGSTQRKSLETPKKNSGKDTNETSSEQNKPIFAAGRSRKKNAHNFLNK